MKKLLALLILVAAVAWGGGQTVDQRVLVWTNTWTVANSLATNAALLTTTGKDPAGVPVRQGGWVAACASAPSGQTFTSGVLRAYVQMPVYTVDAGVTYDAGHMLDGGIITVPALPVYRWIAYPALDWTLTGSVRDQCSGDKQVGTGIGRFAYVEDNVALSGGTTIDVTYSMRSGTVP